MNNTCLLVMIILCSGLIGFGLIVNAADLDLGVGIHVVFLAFLFLSFLLVIWSHRLSSLRAENKSYCVFPCFELRNRRAALSSEEREKYGIKKPNKNRHVLLELTGFPLLIRKARRAIELQGGAEACHRIPVEKVGPPVPPVPLTVKSFEATSVVVPRNPAKRQTINPPTSAKQNGRRRASRPKTKKRYVVNNSFANPNRYLKTTTTRSLSASSTVPTSRLLTAQRLRKDTQREPSSPRLSRPTNRAPTVHHVHRQPPPPPPAPPPPPTAPSPPQHTTVTIV